jgi:hypothetical protein
MGKNIPHCSLLSLSSWNNLGPEHLAADTPEQLPPSPKTSGCS